jgi:signal peptidase I
MTGVLAAWLGRRFVVATVRGSSMEPTFHPGDRVLARRRRTPSVGDVVVVRPPDRSGFMIKRVFAVPGDPVPRALFPALADVAEAAVPPGQLVLLGDNEPVSDDSRRLGYFALDGVVGVALRKLRAGPLPAIVTARPRSAAARRRPSA